MSEFRQFINEAFDTVSDFLLNPAHRNKTWSELFKEFEKSGGKFLSSGTYGQVFEHPNWPYVLKMFEDSHYLKFARFAYRHPHIGFPKFFGMPQKIIPFYRRSKSRAIVYIARVEKLQEIQDRVMLKEILSAWQEGVSYIDGLKKGYADQEYDKNVWDGPRSNPRVIKIKRFQRVMDIIEKYPQSKNLYEAIYIVENNIKESSMDITGRNIMQRSNGELVLIDPVWAGSNPYMDFMQQMRSEIGDYESEPSEPEDLMGGKLPKKIKPKKIR